MKKNLVKYTLEIEVVFQRFKLTRAPICEWIINRPLRLLWCPSFVRSKILVSSTIAFFLEGIWQAYCGSTFFYVTQLNYQHHLPLLRLLKGPGKNLCGLCSASFRKWGNCELHGAAPQQRHLCPCKIAKALRMPKEVGAHEIV